MATANKYGTLKPLEFKDVYRETPRAVMDCNTPFGRFLAFKTEWSFQKPGCNWNQAGGTASNIDDAIAECNHYYETEVAKLFEPTF